MLRLKARQAGGAERVFQVDNLDHSQVETVATTLALGEQNHAEELKRVCLEFVSRNLGAVMLTEGYQHMIRSCPQLQVWAECCAEAFVCSLV